MSVSLLESLPFRFAAKELQRGQPPGPGFSHNSQPATETQELSEHKVNREWFRMVVLVKRTSDAVVPSQDREEVLVLERCIFQGQLLLGK